MPVLDRLLDPLMQMIAPHGLLAWAATYLLHSTLLLGAAWAASRLLAGRSLRLEERLWKAALVGALFTATIQTGVAALPSGDAESAAPVTVATAAAAPEAVEIRALPEVPGTSGGSTSADVADVAAHPGLSRLSALLPGWQRLALAVWALGALLATAALALRWTRLRLHLRRRRDVTDGPTRRLLDRLLESTASRRRVRLTGTEALPVPVALGVGEREICLPDRALRELDDRRQEGLLAHELAHLERRDPAWLLLALVTESVLFFQPLNRLARRRLEEIAELECDAWAVRATGDRLGFARCLTEVAGWLVEARPAAAPGAAAMARSRSRLGVRVRRILAGADGESGASDRRWLATAAAAGLLVLALAVPGLAPSTLAADTADAAGADPQVAPGAEGVAAQEEDERRHELRAHREAEAELGEDEAREHEHDDDWDFDFDFDHGVDAEEMSRMMAEAMAAARAGLLDDEELGDLSEEIEDAISEVMESMPELMESQRMAMAELGEALAEMDHELEIEGEELTPEEREELRQEIEREMAAAQEEMRRALEEVRPELEALRGMQQEIEVEVRREMEEAHRELERARQELEREARQLERERRQLEEEKRRIEELREETPEPPAR